MSRSRFGQESLSIIFLLNWQRRRSHNELGGQFRLPSNIRRLSLGMTKSKPPVMRLDLTKDHLEAALGRTIEDSAWIGFLDNDDMFYAVKNDHAIAGLATVFEVFRDYEQEVVDAIGAPPAVYVEVVR
jgi:hypothetical protein